MTGQLPLIWAAITSFAIIMYVILDGFDLGIGILFPWVHSKTHRDVMVNTIAPVWDGNETWLVFGAAVLYGAFPIAYSTLLPMLYMPIMVMLAALIFRGVAFEFRLKAQKSLFLWDIAFSSGSTLAAFCQGLVLGTFILGYEPSIASLRAFTTPLQPLWLTPFSVMAGFGVVAGYALLGSTWLIMKTEGDLQKTMFDTAKTLLVIITFFLAIVSIWTPFLHPAIMERWFSIPNFYYLLPLPLLTGLGVLYAAYSLHKRYEKLPFILSVCLFVFSYIGLVISIWPYVVPRKITFWEAASDPKALYFLLVGALILIPVLLAYTIYSYRVFRGKVKPEHDYYS